MKQKINTLMQKEIFTLEGETFTVRNLLTVSIYLLAALIVLGVVGNIDRAMGL